MSLNVGDLVSEDHTLYWKFYNKSYIFLKDEADPSSGLPKRVIGIVTSVHKRYPDAFFDIPYYVYKIKWLNAPQGSYWDDKYFYEDELILLSRVESEERPDPSYEQDIDVEEKKEDE